MTDDIDILEKTLAEYKQAKRIKRINEELLEQLHGSVYYLLKYSEKYNIPLPKKNELVRMLEKSDSIIEQITPSTERKHLKDSTDNETEPHFWFCFIIGCTV